MTIIGELQQWAGDGENSEEPRYPVATYSYTCTAYVRTVLRRALALQGHENVWSGTEYVNAARTMVGQCGGPSFALPDVRVWKLTKLELMTIHRALEWRRGKRAAGRVDLTIGSHILSEWEQVENEIHSVLREVWHSEGKYWV